jgi:hypothetical protein
MDTNRVSYWNRGWPCKCCVAGVRTGLIVVLLTSGALHGAKLELKPETLQTWEAYVQKATQALKARAERSGPFLLLEEHADRMAQVRAGEIAVWPVSETNPIKVPSGLIHDWIGAAFIPGARMDDVLGVVRNYSRYKDIYNPGVLDAKLLKQTSTEDRFSLMVRNGSYFSKTAIDGDFQSSFFRVDDRRWYSVSCSTRVQEVENYRRPGEHVLPPDEGHGYIWRMCGLSQLEERDGGVYVNEETLALSRDVPAGLRWVAGPIIRRVSREMLATSMEKSRTAVGAKVNETNVALKRGPDVCGHVGPIGCFR